MNLDLSPLTNELADIKLLLQTLNERTLNLNTPIAQRFDINGLIDYIPWEIAKPTIYYKLANNEIPGHKQGKSWYFLKSEIDLWLSGGKIKTKSDLQDEVDNELSK